MLIHSYPVRHRFGASALAIAAILAVGCGGSTPSPDATSTAATTAATPASQSAQSRPAQTQPAQSRPAASEAVAVTALPADHHGPVAITYFYLPG